eukprot:6197382-Pleurochrysis_carterae.AAC.4
MFTKSERGGSVQTRRKQDILSRRMIAFVRSHKGLAQKPGQLQEEYCMQLEALVVIRSGAQAARARCAARQGGCTYCLCAGFGSRVRCCAICYASAPSWPARCEARTI